MFCNISNHLSSKWPEAQKSAAEALGGQVVDIAFPAVSTLATTQEISALADDLATQVADGDVAMVQGEFTLTYALVQRLRSRGVQVVAGCSDRKTVEVFNSDGSVTKTAQFVFVCFRDFE